MDLPTIIQKIKQFNNERDWDQFHNPKDILLALTSEVGELAECYRWLSEEEIKDMHSNTVKKEKVEEEIADVFMNLLILCYKTDIDPIKVIENKIEKNRKKYPIEKSKGIHSNPLQGFKGSLAK